MKKNLFTCLDLTEEGYLSAIKDLFENVNIILFQKWSFLQPFKFRTKKNLDVHLKIHEMAPTCSKFFQNMQVKKA